MKRLPRWLWVVILVVVVAVALGLVVPYFLDVDRYRTTIASAIEQETGRKVTIGKIHARLLPSVGFVVENFALGNPPGFPQGNVLSIDAIHGSLAWAPLFRREFQLSALTLERPRLILLQDDRGNINYDFASKAKPGVRPAQSALRIADIDSIKLADVGLTLGRITGRKQALVPTLRVEKVNAELSNVPLDEKRLKQCEADVDLAGVQVFVSAFKEPIEFRSGELILDNGAVQSEFEVDLAKATTVKGQLRVEDIQRPVATFELSTALFDLDQLIPSGAPSAPATPARPRKSELLAQGRVAAERMRWAPYEAANATASVRIFTDRVEVWPMTMALYGGSLGISARLDQTQSPQRFSANVELRNLDVGRLLAASPTTKGKMTGTAELTLQVFGSLSDNLLDSLTGNGSFAVRDGRFPGFNVSGTLRTLAKVQRTVSFGALGADLSGETRFSAITGDLSIAQGRVSSNRIHTDSNIGTVDLRGSFGFDQTLDYDGQALMAQSSSGPTKSPVGAITSVIGGAMKQTVGRISVPFAVRGTFQDPKIQPGRGLPGISTSAPAQQQTQQPPEKKKGILGIFRRP